MARWQVILSRWTGMVGAVAVLHLAHLLGMIAGQAAIGGEMQIGRYLVAELNSLLLVAALGSILLGVSLS